MTGGAKETLAIVYLDWARSFESAEKFTEAEAKYKQAIKADPNPDSDEGPAAQAKSALPSLHRTWAKSLLAGKKYEEAIEHLNIALSLLSANGKADVVDELIKAHIQWALSLTKVGDYNGALDKLELADKIAASASAKTEVEDARAGVISDFASSTSVQAKQLMKDTAQFVCRMKTAPTPRVPIIGINPEVKRGVLYGQTLTLSSKFLADSPQNMYYAICITSTQRLI